MQLPRCTGGNSVWGYRINLATVGAATGFIFFVLVPGYTPGLAWHSRPGILDTGDNFFDNRSANTNQRPTKRSE